MVRLDEDVASGDAGASASDDGWAQRVATEEKGREGILARRASATREGRAPAAPPEAANRVAEDPRAPDAAGARKDAAQVHDDAMPISGCRLK